MLEVIKYGSNKYGVWVVGHLKYNGIDIFDIFNTNIKDESELKDRPTLKPKEIKISKDKNYRIVFRLEF